MKSLTLLLFTALLAPLVQVSVPVSAAPPDGDGGIPSDLPYVPISGDLSVHPGPDAWLRISRPTISILIVNTTFTPDLDASWIDFDGRRSAFVWTAANRTIFLPMRDPLADGTHSVHAQLEDFQGNQLIASWAFHLDTVVPFVVLDPIPGIADRRVFDINGTVNEPNLARVEVNGFAAILEGDRFLVQVLLWPGRNDLLATATDRAGNRGFSQAGIRWAPSPPANVEYAPFVHPNKSFIARFPTTWEVYADYELEPGYTADVAALEPANASLPHSSIVVDSRLAGEGFNEALLLGILENAVVISGAQSGVSIVSRPRLLDGTGRTVVGQFSLVAPMPTGDRVFQQVTAFWNRAAGRIWIMIGSTATDKVEAQWHALATASETFHAVEPPPSDSGGEPPGQSVERAFFVTTAAILIILAVFAAGLYSYRKSRRESPPTG